jgi:hypothetical protein
MTISQISSGTLIDQKVLSEVIETVNAITSSQYTSVSSIANGTTKGQQELKPGQWAVSTQFDTRSVATFKTKTRMNGPFTVDFNMSFDPVPLVTGTIYSATANSQFLKIPYSIVITNITSSGFTYVVVTAPATHAELEAAAESTSIMFTAIGKIKQAG